jgi:hypothetical protein
MLKWEIDQENKFKVDESILDLDFCKLKSENSALNKEVI